MWTIPPSSGYALLLLFGLGFLAVLVYSVALLALLKRPRTSHRPVWLRVCQRIWPYWPGLTRFLWTKEYRRLGDSRVERLGRWMAWALIAVASAMIGCAGILIWLVVSGELSG